VTLTVLNPATEEQIAELEQAGVEEADAAIERARVAFPGWRAVTPADPARLLRRLATLVEEHAEELARIESRNIGKPISGARGEIGMVAQVFHFYAGAVDKHHDETIPVAGGPSVRVQTPFGGFKQSGFGRELGPHALDGYSEIKSVFISTEG
jgi:acyl-CoA reductase-like NAD-dependent aldehyde dehydrogenase